MDEQIRRLSDFARHHKQHSQSTVNRVPTPPPEPQEAVYFNPQRRASSSSSTASVVAPPSTLAQPPSRYTGYRDRSASISSASSYRASPVPAVSSYRAPPAWSYRAPAPYARASAPLHSYRSPSTSTARSSLVTPSSSRAPPPAPAPPAPAQTLVPSYFGSRLTPSYFAALPEEDSYLPGPFYTPVFPDPEPIPPFLFDLFGSSLESPYIDLPIAISSPQPEPAAMTTDTAPAINAAECVPASAKAAQAVKRDKKQFLLDLERDGYVVVPGVIPEKDCDAYQEGVLSWLEAFPYGFKRDDPSTWNNDSLPINFTGGMYVHYACTHEDFVWNIRAQSGIKEVFAHVWGTDDLITSFDAINCTFPIGEKGRKDIEPTGAWPHMDQNPRTVADLLLYQGIANLAPNGPDDGGLVVMKGSHLKHAEFFESIGGFRPEKDAGPQDHSYHFTPEDHQWYKDHGCEQVKVCAGKGDLILWDSRTMHWNQSPVGDQTRFVVYVCQCPREWMSEEALKRKKEIFDTYKVTTHWPNMNVVHTERKPGQPDLSDLKRPDGSPEVVRREPLNKVKATPEVLSLVGVRN